MGQLINEQGEKIDIIDEQMDSARSNVKDAGTLLEEGKKEHMSANKKKICIFMIIFILLLIIIIPVVVKVL